MIPTGDLTGLRTALSAGSGLVADASAAFPTVTVNSIDYLAGNVACTEAMRAALVAFFEAAPGRRYYVRDWDGDVITACGPTQQDAGKAFNVAGLVADADNYNTINSVMAGAWTTWLSDYVTNVTGTWQPHANAASPPATINSTGTGIVYNPQVYRSGSYVPGMLSEGQSFGMLLSALNNDPAWFYNIWNRTKILLQTRTAPDKTLYWARYFSDNALGYGTAPDGDLLCCLALGLGHLRGWGSGAYLTDLQALGASLIEKCVATHGGRLVFSAASRNDNNGSIKWIDDPDVGTLVFPHYLIIPAFRMMAQLDTANTATWTQLIDDSLYFIKRASEVAAENYKYGHLPPETFRVYPDGSVHLSEQTGNRQKHWYSVARVFLFMAMAAADGHQASINFLRDEPCAQKYREYYAAYPGTLPTHWNTDGSYESGTNDSVCVLATMAAMESVQNPAFAKTLVADVQALYLSGTKKWFWNDDSNFIQFITFAGLLTAGKILGKQQAALVWPASAPSRKLHYIAQRSSVTIDSSNRVSQWNNAVAGGYNLTQTTDGYKPLFIPSNRFGLPAVRFDGIDDFLKLTGTLDLIKNVGQCSFLMAASFNSFAASQYLMSAQAPSPYRMRFGPRITSGGLLSIEAVTLDADTASSVAEGAASLSAGIHLIRFDVNYQHATHASGRIVVGDDDALAETTFGLATGASNTSNTNLNKFTVGCQNETSAYLNADVYHIVMMTSALPSAQADADIKAAFAAIGVKS